MKKKRKFVADICLSAVRKRDYTQVPNKVLRDPKMTAKAKVALMILLGNKKGWKSHKSTFYKMMPERETAILNAISELEQCGFLKRLRCREIVSKQYIGDAWVYTDNKNIFNLNKAIKQLKRLGVEIVGVRKQDRKATRGKPPSGKPTLNNIKHKNSKKITISRRVKTPPVDSENYKPTILERNKEYNPQAQKLKDIVQSRKNINISAQIIFNWSNEIRILVESRGVDVARIDAALEWYEQHNQDKFVPIIESGFSLKEKWLNLENAMERDDTNTSLKNSGMTVSPKAVMKKRFGAKNGVAKSMLRNYNKAIELLPESDKLTVSMNLGNMYDWIVKNTEKNVETESQEFYDEVGPPEYVVGMFITWLEDQEWIENKTANSLDSKAKLFRNFIDKKSKEIGKHILTGNYI